MTTDSPSRLYVIGVYFKRIIRWRRDSSPYISIDAIAKFADVNLYPPKFRQRQPSFKAIQKASVIFCPSNKLDEFLSKYSGLISPKVIISGNSDHEFKSIPENLPDSLNLLLLQNSLISDNKLIWTLPIGVENFRFGVNGNPRLFPFTGIPQKARGRIIFGPFGNTHPIRQIVTEKFRNQSGYCEFLEGRIPPRRYRKIIAENFEYVACVRGNGVDTHRLWETLYRGRKPIAISDKWLESLIFLKPYVYTLSAWEVESVKNIDKLRIKDFNPVDIEELWISYWKKMIEKARD